MVAKITIPKNIEAALNYNEKKVQKGAAVCLYAANYLNDAEKMNFYQKLNAFENLNTLNKRATTKTLHVSLNFDPSEKLPDNKLVDIASIYMEKIGFGEQPFLVYKHEDAGHPHIHIVSTTIKPDGNRINTHNIGRNQSEKARKEIEQLYGLIKAERQQEFVQQRIKPIDIQKAVYGKQETKRSISNIVTFVFNQYKFASLPEFNAALKQFNIVADRGKEDGRIYRNHGLVYRILDEKGNKLGVPIKASSIGCKPTLTNLEAKYRANESTKDSLKERIKNAIDDCHPKTSESITELIAELSKLNIYTLLRRNTDGRLYGITFVDNQNRVVFNGSDLGKNYSVAALQRSLPRNNANFTQKDEVRTANSLDTFSKEVLLNKSLAKSTTTHIKSEGVLDILTSVKEQHDHTPFGLLKKKKKKKRKNNDV